MRMRLLLALVGLLAPVASAAQEPAWTNEQTVAVQLSSYKFSPHDIVLQAGRPYRLHLENVSSKDHSFSSKGFFASATVRTEDRPKVERGRVEVPGQQSVDVELVANQPGEYRLECDHFMHSAFGMKGAITVK
jgi:uncharacterized cupredoxin-like copper-binding protein